MNKLLAATGLSATVTVAQAEPEPEPEVVVLPQITVTATPYDETVIRTPSPFVGLRRASPLPITFHRLWQCASNPTTLQRYDAEPPLAQRRSASLVADEEADRPVLHAERACVRIGVEAMSDGTADQLYLALRLAALDLRRASHPQMPLVLDDVLITSDDERVGNILRALARFAEGGQVMLFTHHTAA